jgi:predicted dehydrogenase
LIGIITTTMAGEIAVGVVGAGFGRYGLVPAFRRDSRCRVVAFCAATQASAARFASALAIPRSFTDFGEMLRSVPLRAVAIAVPPQAQPPIARAALDAGIAVFAEKPLACDLASACELAGRAKAAGIGNAVDFMFPELTTWQRARELVREGRIGRIRHVMLDWRMESFDNARARILWKTDARAGGGVLSHFGSHCFYNLEWLLGPIVGLSAHLGAAKDLRASADTMATVALEFGSGSTGSISLCSAAPHGGGQRLEIYGDTGALLLANGTADPVVGFRLMHGGRNDASMAEIAREEADRMSAEEDQRVAPVSRLVRRFIDAVVGGPAVRPSFADGARVQALIETARVSAEGGVWLRVPPTGDGL